MPGTLYVVATPIGNLEDITLRALRVLREVELVAAEDTRRTARLLLHHAITTPQLSFHEHNMASRLPQLVARLLGGARIALVSDAGTPGISDPGVRLVQRCRERRIPVTVIPGASAPLVAAVASGFPLVPLTIYGFAPARSNDRKRWLAALVQVPHTVTFFETPHRITQTLMDLSSSLGERQIVVARELTKVFEELIHGTAAEVAQQLEQTRGEFTIVVGPALERTSPEQQADDQALAEEFGRMKESGEFSRRQKIATVARKFGMSTRDVYAAIERVRRSDDANGRTPGE